MYMYIKLLVIYKFFCCFFLLLKVCRVLGIPDMYWLGSVAAIIIDIRVYIYI